MGDPTQVVGKRYGAWLIDGVIYFVLNTVIVRLLGTSAMRIDEVTDLGSATPEMFCDAYNRFNDGFCIASSNSATVIRNSQTGLLVFAALFVVFCVVQGVLGGSLGKRAVGLRIVKRDGSIAGIGASFIRTFAWIIDALPCIPLVGMITMATSKGHRRVGDMAAGTFVVAANRVGQPIVLPGEPGYGRLPNGAFPGGGPVGSTPWQQASSAAGYGAGSSSGYEADTPTWDAARNTYIKYDSAQSAWLELDTRTNEWGPIST